MKEIKKVVKDTGKVILALLTGILMPILIWVALGVVLNQKLREKKLKPATTPTIGEILAKAGLTIQEEVTSGKTVAAKTITQQPVLETCELLARAGLTIHDDTVVKHCWEILNCPPERHETCPTYVRRDIPFWVANGLGKGG